MKMLCYLLLFLLLYSCRPPECYQPFEFHFPFATSEQDTFGIGDTLWVAMSVPNQMVDHQTGEWVDITQFELYFELGLFQLDTPFYENGLPYFEVIEAIGDTAYQGYNPIAHVKSTTEKTMYLGFVPRKKGIFLLSMNLPLDYFYAEEAEHLEDRLSVTNSLCTRQNVTRYSEVQFNEGDINFHLIKDLPCQRLTPDYEPYCYTDSIELARLGGYAFMVN